MEDGTVSRSRLKATRKDVDAQRFDHAESPSPYYWGDTPLSLT